MDALTALMAEEERPVGGKGALTEAPTSFLVAKAGESMVGFAGYHTGAAEVPVLIADWIFVTGSVRRKGLGSHLVLHLVTPFAVLRRHCACDGTVGHSSTKGHSNPLAECPTL